MVFELTLLQGKEVRQQSSWHRAAIAPKECQRVGDIS
jgi:hypothetical protein